MDKLEQEQIKYYTGCKTIFDYYGIEQQKIQFIQELAELIQAITKKKSDNFIEELADVQVMIDQFTISDPELDKMYQKIMLQKVERQLKRIGEENAENNTDNRILHSSGPYNR